jgi:hypothetical protein
VCHYERSVPRHAPQHNYTHCGFFGDPHLRTFGDEFQTCRVEGAWPLIHNKFLSVQVTNSPVVPGSLATATSKVGGGPPTLCSVRPRLLISTHHRARAVSVLTQKEYVLQSCVTIR